MQDLERNGKRHKQTQSCSWVVSSPLSWTHAKPPRSLLLESCRLSQLQWISSLFPAKQWNSLFSIFLHIADVGQIFLITMEIETRILNDRVQEDEEEKEEASRWTGLSVQSVPLWTGLGLGRLQVCWLQSSAVVSGFYSSLHGQWIPLSRLAAPTAPHRHRGSSPATPWLGGDCWDR